MCGLVGYVITKAVPSAHLVSKYKRYFDKALLLDVVRGFDSTGVVTVKEDGEHAQIKKALPSYDFIGSRQYEKFFKATTTNQNIAALGHNRAATRGAVNANNAHPFRHGSVTLMHNGTLDSAVGVGNKYDVDSENLCYALSQCSTEQEVIKLLETIEGAYALVWYDEDSNTVNFARNEERPLVYQKTPEGFLYASEPWLIEGGKSEQFQQEINTVGKIKELEVGKWVKVDLWTGETHTKDFTPDEGYYRYYSYRIGGGNKMSGKSGAGNKAENNTSNKSPVLSGDYGRVGETLGLLTGDRVLLQYRGHTESTLNNTYTVESELVSSRPNTIRYRCVTSGVTAGDLNKILKKKQEILVGKFAGSFEVTSSDTKEVRIWCSKAEPKYTKKEFLDGSVTYTDDTPRVSYEFDNSVEDKSDVKYTDSKGNTMAREKMKEVCEKGCGWCSHVIDIDHDEYLWYLDELLHEDCYEELESEVV